MNHALAISATIIGLCAVTAANTALNRADESDRRAAALELRVNYLECALTLESKIDRDMKQLETKKGE